MNIEGNSIKRIDCSEIQNCFSFWDFEKNIEKRKRIEFEVENNIRIMYAYILNKNHIKKSCSIERKKHLVLAVGTRLGLDLVRSLRDYYQ